VGQRFGVRMYMDPDARSARRVTFVDKRRRIERRLVSAGSGNVRQKVGAGEGCGVDGVWRCEWVKIWMRQ